MPGHWKTVSVDGRESDDRAKLQPGDGDDRNERVLEGMPEVHQPVRQTARPGELDVIGPDDFQHLGSDQPHDQGHLVEAERDGGQDQRLQAGDGQKAGRPPGSDLHGLAASEARQPLQRNGKQEDQQDPDEERRSEMPISETDRNSLETGDSRLSPA